MNRGIELICRPQPARCKLPCAKHPEAAPCKNHLNHGRGVQGTNGTVRHAFPWELALVLAQTCDRHCGMCGPPEIFEPLGHVGSHFALSLAAHSVPCLAGAATSRSARTPRIAPRAETWTVSNAPAAAASLAPWPCRSSSASTAAESRRAPATLCDVSDHLM